MQTSFTAGQLADPDIRESEGILRKCVHCGFCTATCPTYVLLGDERDSPRGRIYLIKEMLEKGRPASATVVRHIDRCLSCLACVTTCPSGVDYMHLVDHARAHIERTYRRPPGERLLRWLLAHTLPHPGRFALLAAAGRLVQPLAGLLPGRLRAGLALLPRSPGRTPRAGAGVHPARGTPRLRVALLAGCVQDTLAPDINAATIRLLTRLGVEVVVAPDAGCCGALVHHMGRVEEARAAARRNVAAWEALTAGGLDAIVANASGCGTMLKDYAHLLRDDAAWAPRAQRIAALARDVSEIVASLGLESASAPPLTVAYHAACSLQHGQRLASPPRDLLTRAGYRVVDPVEGHLCCGSAGTYNILQPALADRLGARKAARLAATRANVVAAGNVGCMVQIARHAGLPVVHTVELLDWATGGPRPAALGEG